MRKRGRVSVLLVMALLSSTGVCYADGTQENGGISNIAADEKREVSFIDIGGSWAKEYIEEAAEKGILQGVDEIHFCPKAYMTRGEFTEVIARMLKLNRGEATGKFRDVESIYYYAGYIEELSNLGILYGYEGNYFKPNKEITREEMISLLIRTYEYIKGKTISYHSAVKLKFNDNDQISEWALEDIKKAYELGFIEGDEKNKLNPKRLATREETAKLIILFHT